MLALVVSRGSLYDVVNGQVRVLYFANTFLFFNTHHYALSLRARDLRQLLALAAL